MASPRLRGAHNGKKGYLYGCNVPVCYNSCRCRFRDYVLRLRKNKRGKDLFLPTTVVTSNGTKQRQPHPEWFQVCLALGMTVENVTTTSLRGNRSNHTTIDQDTTYCGVGLALGRIDAGTTSIVVSLEGGRAVYTLDTPSSSSSSTTGASRPAPPAKRRAGKRARSKTSTSAGRGRAKARQRSNTKKSKTSTVALLSGEAEPRSKKRQRRRRHQHPAAVSAPASSSTSSTSSHPASRLRETSLDIDDASFTDLDMPESETMAGDGSNSSSSPTFLATGPSSSSSSTISFDSVGFANGAPVARLGTYKKKKKQKKTSYAWRSHLLKDMAVEDLAPRSGTPGSVTSSGSASTTTRNPLSPPRLAVPAQHWWPDQGLQIKAAAAAAVRLPHSSSSSSTTGATVTPCADDEEYLACSHPYAAPRQRRHHRAALTTTTTTATFFCQPSAVRAHQPGHLRRATTATMEWSTTRSPQFAPPLNAAMFDADVPNNSPRAGVGAGVAAWPAAHNQVDDDVNTLCLDAHQSPPTASRAAMAAALSLPPFSSNSAALVNQECQALRSAVRGDSPSAAAAARRHGGVPTSPSTSSTSSTSLDDDNADGDSLFAAAAAAASVPPMLPPVLLSADHHATTSSTATTTAVATSTASASAFTAALASTYSGDATAFRSSFAASHYSTLLHHTRPGSSHLSLTSLVKAL